MQEKKKNEKVKKKKRSRGGEGIALYGIRGIK